ncbi:MAG: sugar ABC transporter substrate-binding protein [Endomicrobia bacterium]|nr:sugar ABC transporter substrate-binding protein [Endomicrobiia bacterium]
MQVNKIFKIMILMVITTFPIHSQIVINLTEFPRWSHGPTGDKFGWIKEQIKIFEQKYPEVKIKLTELPWEGGPEKRQISVASGNPPDITSYGLSEILKPITQGLIEPVDSYLTENDKKDYYPSALESFKYQNKIWAFPWLTSGVMLFINEDLCNLRGVVLPKDGVWTYDEFVSAMKKLTFDKDGDGKIDVYGFAYYITALDQSVWPFLYMYGGRPLSEDLQKYTFDSPQAISGLQKLIDLSTVHKVALPRCAAMGPGDIWQAFAKEQRVACAPWGSWAISALRDPKKSSRFKFKVLHYPVNKKGDKPITFIGANGFVIFKQKDNKKLKLCVEFVRQLTNTENQKLLIHYASFPTRKSASKIFENDEIMLTAQKIISYGVIVPPHPEWTKIDDKLYRQIQLACLGEISAKDALTLPKMEIQRILDHSGFK